MIKRQLIFVLACALLLINLFFTPSVQAKTLSQVSTLEIAEVEASVDPEENPFKSMFKNMFKPSPEEIMKKKEMFKPTPEEIMKKKEMFKPTPEEIGEKVKQKMMIKQAAKEAKAAKSATEE